MPRLTLEEVKTIVEIHLYRQNLPEEQKPYFDWWVREVADGTYKPKSYPWLEYQHRHLPF